MELNVTPKITPKNLDTQIISKKFLFTEYIEKVPVYRASEKSDDISWDFKNGCDRFKIIPLSPQKSNPKVALFVYADDYKYLISKVLAY